MNQSNINTSSPSAYVHNNITTSITNNIFYNIWVGAVLINDQCNNYEVSRNLVMGHYALPPVFHMTTPTEYAFNHPIAAFSVFSKYGIFEGNKVAGSVDNAFAIVQTYFIEKAIHTPGFPIEICNCTFSTGLNTKYTKQLEKLQIFDPTIDFLLENEAVASRNGLTIVALSTAEVDEYIKINLNCGLVTNFKLWRNGDMGIISIDQSAQVIVFDTILAENSIGMSLNVYALKMTNFFLGLMNSKIIGIIGNEVYNTSSSASNSNIHNNNSTNSSNSSMAYCSALPDTRWPMNYSDENTSILGMASYSRVGIMSPQFLNAPQTCTFVDNATCLVPYALHSSCALPYGKRYGLPVTLQYAEHHIYGNLFAGFCHASAASDPVDLSGDEIYKTIAITSNPSQADRLALPILEKNEFYINKQTQIRYNDTSSTSSHDESELLWQLQPVMTTSDIFSFREIDDSILNHECNSAGICVQKKPLVTLIDIDGSMLKHFVPQLSYFENNETLNYPASGISFSSAYGQIVFNDKKLFQIPTSKCFSLRRGDKFTEEFMYCPRDEIVYDTHCKLVGTNYSNTPVGFVSQPFRPFELYLSYWDDVNPTIYTYFNIRSHPADTIIRNSNNQTQDEVDTVNPENNGNSSGSTNNLYTYYYYQAPAPNDAIQPKDKDSYDFNGDGRPDDILSQEGEPLDPRFTYGFKQISFSPEYEPCSKKLLFNRRKQYFANGYLHYIELQDEEIFEWTISWLSPNPRFVMINKCL